MSIRTAAFGAALLVGCAGASAQIPMDKLVADKQVDKVVEVALKNIHHVKCEPNKSCEKASEDELKNPPISRKQASAAIKAGVISGMMQWCGLKWQLRSLRPLIAYHKNAEKMTNRQLALMSMVHSMQQSALYRELSKDKGCPAETKEDMNKKFPGEALEN